MTTDLQHRVVRVLGVACLAGAFAGLMTGTRPPPERPLTEHEEPEARAIQAKSYTQLRDTRRGVNGSMYEAAFRQLRGEGPGLLDPVEKTEEERELDLAARRERRAYAGAPPTIPHPVQERDPAACSACHSEGARIAGIRAPMMSHQPYTMCVQCHATTKDEAPALINAGTMTRESLFDGQGEPGHGAQAWEGAPPTIPHPTFMRENCSSCHGRQGPNGIRTPHPYQQSCTQCHASAGKFDQGKPPAPPPGFLNEDVP